MDKKMKIVNLEISPESKLTQALKKLKKESVRVMPVKLGFDKSQAIDTRFGGFPYAEAGEKAPVCECCGKPLTFIFQFRDSYDKDLNPSGALHSVYYCFDCTPIGRPEEEKGQWKVVTHENPDVSKFVEQKESVSQLLKPMQCSLSKVFTLPDYETIESHYPDIVEMCEAIDCYADDLMSGYEDAVYSIGGLTEPSTIVGGYPSWIQGEGSQVCPECGGEMELACQIDSEEAVDLMFGDAGCLYVFRCPEHKDKFAIEMQCF